jgi:hypothetical protein
MGGVAGSGFFSWITSPLIGMIISDMSKTGGCRKPGSVRFSCSKCRVALG